METAEPPRSPIITFALIGCVDQLAFPGGCAEEKAAEGAGAGPDYQAHRDVDLAVVDAV